MDDLEPLTDAERKLLEAVQTSGLCDLSQDDDTDRTVRAAVLKAILSGEGEAWGIGAGAAINLRGAVVSGDLGGFGGSRLPPIRLESCRFEDSVDFSGATFTGDAGFHEATFTGDAWFHEATFTGAAGFDGATFTGDAWFGGATFTGDAWFGGATFTGDAGSSGATFTGDAGSAGRPSPATPGSTRRAFAGHLPMFHGALAHRLSFSRALFSAPDPGPWIASTISLDRTTLAVRSRISITATEIDASRLQAREGAHLVLHCARVDLSDSEFLRRSIVSSPAAAEQIPPAAPQRQGSPAIPPQKARAAAAAAAKKFRDDLN